MSDRQWAEKAAFMRDVGATYAEWGDDGESNLVKLQLAPLAVAAPARPLGPAAQMAARFQESTGQQMSVGEQRARQRHETMFAATSVRPPFPSDKPATSGSDVPRAVRAKQDAVTGGRKKKRSKR